MYLKRLESVGFKSFAERINVEFVPGLTAVVGPNGSGKSNITDAIRWVLGEQSVRSLRGSKMEDIIFQGSDSRNPLNVAEVILTLDNTSKELPIDYDEVSITRRVYRSGVSEFYINKQACRLKDIVELFMDSGLGRDAFSIIGQGQVEEILSSKADERRTIFEEAAGVLKYKQRKQKAEYKLAETEENLFRIEDIMHEIEQQLTPLKKQASTAETYVTYKKQLQSEEVSFIITQIRQLHSTWEELRKTIDDQKDTHIAATTSIQKKEIGIEETKEAMRILDQEVEQLQEKLLEQTKFVEQNEGQKKLFEERTRHASSNKENVQKQMKRLEEQIHSTKQQFKEEKEIEHTIQAELLKIEKDIGDIQDKLSASKEVLEEDIEEQKSAYIDLLNEQAAKRNELQSTERYLAQLEQKELSEEEKAEQLQQTYKEIEKNYLVSKETYEEQNSVYEKQVKENEHRKASLQKKREAFEQSQQQLHAYNHKMATLESRRDVLTEMKEAFQGFYHGVKRVLQARDEGKLQDIHGAMVELMTVPKEYTIAIETTLGGQAQHIVTSNDRAAREAISWLKKTNYGRATFLPLESIQPRFVPMAQKKQVENHHGFVGIAADLIEIDKAFKKAVEHVMGHVLVTKTLKDANEIAQITKRRFRVVTLEGDVVNPGGAMSGGATQRKGPSLFTRDHELEEVQARLDKAKHVIADKTEEVEKMRASVASLIEEIEQEEEHITESRMLAQQYRDTYYQYETKYTSVKDQLELTKADYTQFLEDQSLYKEQVKTLKSELVTIEKQAQSIETSIEELTEQQASFESDRQAHQNLMHRSEVEHAEHNERFKNQQYKVRTLKKQLDEANDQYDTYQIEYNQLVELEKASGQITQFEERIRESTKDIEKINKQIQLKRSKRYDETTWIESEERELKETQKSAQSLLQDIQKKEVQENRMDVELENLLSHLQQEYTLTYERAANEYPFVEDVDQAKEKVEEIKQSIAQLGTVNLGAIEEYDRITERNEFLTEQREDLVQGKETLYEIIREMDDEMKTRFSETFNHIKDEFSVVFKELFGGGSAKLQLTDPHNLLDTGIDIIAQPPGKKLQHLGLLSGGERSLTAIALLFAILRVRPVPFCVLDEVEAALDEANVVRFADYVRQHSAATQFIVITHRKGTMEKADVLYGITMQESGVSRLVSVRLEETDELMKQP